MIEPHELRENVPVRPRVAQVRLCLGCSICCTVPVKLGLSI